MINLSFFTLKKFIKKKYPYLFLAFPLNETQKAVLGESLLTFYLVQHDCIQNHHMLGCIGSKTSLSCGLLIMKHNQT